MDTLLADLSGKHAHGFFDLSRPEQQDALCETAWTHTGGIHVLVQCAGVDILTEPAKSLSYEEKLAALLAVDVTATIRVARDISRRMTENGVNGVIINIGWDAVERGIGGDSAELFAAAKGAVTAFSKSLAQSVSLTANSGTAAGNEAKRSDRIEVENDSAVLSGHSRCAVLHFVPGCHFRRKIRSAADSMFRCH